MISIIVAYANGRVIGKDGKIPWHLPDDIQHFKRITSGHIVVMGRKTFEEVNQPLPGRTNIVITRQPGWHADGAITTANLQEAIQKAR